MRIKRILVPLTAGLALIAASAVVGPTAHAPDRLRATADANVDSDHVANIKWTPGPAARSGT
jgi:hypothetical protein